MQEELKWTVCLTAVMVCALEFGGGGYVESQKPAPAPQVEEVKPATKNASKPQTSAPKSGGSRTPAKGRNSVRPRTVHATPGV